MKHFIIGVTPLRCPYCFWFLVENVNSDGWVCENPSCRKIFKKR